MPQRTENVSDPVVCAPIPTRIGAQAGIRAAEAGLVATPMAIWSARPIPCAKTMTTGARRQLVRDVHGRCGARPSVTTSPGYFVRGVARRCFSGLRVLAEHLCRNTGGQDRGQGSRETRRRFEGPGMASPRVFPAKGWRNKEKSGDSFSFRARPER